MHNLTSNFYRYLSICVILSTPVISTSTAFADKEPVKQLPSTHNGFATVKLPDSSIFEGEIKSGLFNGKGRLNWRNGDIYEGDFFNGLIEGHGKLVTSVNDIYTGEFKAGLYDGQGILEYSYGNRYEGKFRQGLFEGEGVLDLNNGDHYSGEFKTSLFHGNGHYITADNVTFNGQFENGAAHGKGTITWKNGSTYNGHLKNWRMHGKGNYYDIQFGTYTGDFFDGHYHGYGTFEQLQGDTYIGEFKNGNFHGNGKLTQSNGDIYVGEFKKGHFDGKGKATYKNGNVYQGTFIKGELTGNGNIIYSNGDTYSGSLSNWTEHGEGISKYADGDSYKGEFIQGIYDGKGELTLTTGDRYVGIFKQGRIDGKGTIYHKNPKGKKKVSKAEWQDGLLVAIDGKVINKRNTPREKYFVEETLYMQHSLLNKSFNTILAGQHNKPELYFLSFAAYGDQDVFMKEALYSRDLFNSHFNTNGRAMVLINHKNTAHNYPMATVGNLKRAINSIGSRMNKNEDILFLFISSHGSEKQGVSVRLGGVYLEGLSTIRLAKILQESGIKWKVIVVSACYSGTFLEALKDDNSMIITSSKPDHVSFGCSDEAEFTFFGRAFFQQAVKETSTFKAAFNKAKLLVHSWEDEKNYSHSEPRLLTTKTIEKQLSNWRNTIKNEAFNDASTTSQ